jgi:nucleotide-binding universal stress UspA family protein
MILPHAESLARAYEAEVILLRVVEPVPVVVGPGGMDGGLYLEKMNAIEADVREYLRAKQIAFNEAGFSCEVVVAQGVPVDVIVQVAQDEDIDLVAMATHGRSGLGNVVFGSVAAGVLHRLQKPLMLVRAWSP